MKEALSAVILASGAGTRLGDLTKDTPKPMLEFGGKPYLQYLVDWLLKSSVDDVVITTYTHPEQIEDFIERQYDDRVRTVRESVMVSPAQSSEFGLRHVRHETSFILTADNIWNVKLMDLARKHRKEQALATAMVTANPNVPNSGKVRVGQNDDKILEMWPSEDTAELIVPTRGASTMGLYIVNRNAIVGNVLATDTSIEREPMNRLRPNLAAYWNEGFFFDYGTPVNYNFLKKNPHIIAENLRN